MYEPSEGNGLLCGSLFSGVGGMDIGFAWAGWRHAFFAEIEPFGRAVLAARFPGVPIYSDVRDVPECERGEWPRLDVLTFGSPCQDLSVAGKRRGLDGDRSGLFWEAMRIAGDGPLRPRALLMENVEGLLSSNGGRDFALVLDAMAERGYRWSYRLLDSQHFAVPQRRRRVFVLAVADDDPRAERIAEVLALGEGSGGDSPTSDPSWPSVASRARGGAKGGRVVGSLTESGGAVTMDHQSFVSGGQYVTADEQRQVVNALTASYAGAGNTQDEITLAGVEAMLSEGVSRVVPTVTSKWAKGSGGPAGAECGNLIATARVANALTKNNAGDGGWHDNEDGLVVSALQGGGERGYRVDAESAAGGHLLPAIGFSHTQGLDPQASEERTPTLRSNGGGMAANVGPAVRRLTPLECERLQGWPEVDGRGWTDIPWNGKEHAPDSKRYAAAGNGVTSTVAYWIAARLAEVLK